MLPMNNAIHPTAQIASNVKLGAGVRIGAYAVIEESVEIADHCVIGAHAVIQPYVKMGAHNTVHPHAVIGGLPQDIGFDHSTVSYVEIGDHNVFREGFTVNRATREKAATRIGSRGYFMNNSHIGHDCSVGDGNIFASGATLGGHAQVGDRVFLGGGVMVHQFCRIGSLAMVQGTRGINKDVIPFLLIGGSPARHYRLNAVGLRRAGVEGERYQVLATAFRRLRNREALTDLPQTPEIVHLIQWLSAESKRGVHGFMDVRDKKTLDL